MPVCIVLGNYTEQGVRNIKQVANLRQAAEQRTQTMLAIPTEEAEAIAQRIP